MDAAWERIGLPSEAVDVLRRAPRVVVHAEIYDIGAELLHEFAVAELEQYRQADLDPLGLQIIDCLADRGTVEDFDELIRPT